MKRKTKAQPREKKTVCAVPKKGIAQDITNVEAVLSGVTGLTFAQFKTLSASWETLKKELGETGGDGATSGPQGIG